MQKLGVFWKIQDICNIMGTEIFKIEEEMTEKMRPQVVNLPSQKSKILQILQQKRKYKFALPMNE